MVDLSQFKLGKKAGVVDDPRTFKARAIMQVEGLPPVLSSWRIAEQKHDWEMHGNDRYGDCAFVTHAHAVAAQEWSSRTKDIPVTTEQVLDFYSKVTGFDRNDPSTDNGAYMIDPMRYRRKNGFGLERDRTPHMITAYAKVDDDSGAEFKQCARLFGGMACGVGLPLRAMTQEVWSLPPADQRDDRDEIYSWGGHSMYLCAFDPQGVTFLTWGREQRATWAWFKAYCDERWVMISEDFFNREQKTPQRLNIAKLEQLLSTL